MSYPPHLQRVVDSLWHSAEEEISSEIYAILDTARDDDIYAKLLVSDIKNICLYEGDQALELSDVAPYLVKLGKDDSFTDWLLNNGWGKNWGIFLESPAGFNRLKQHFRKFITVYDEQGVPLYFRYYDPRVLQVYLPSCNEAELEILFGPVRSYYVENEDRDLIIEFSRIDGRLTQHAVRLTTTVGVHA